MRKHSIWLTGVIALTILAFLAVFKPITFSPRKDPVDVSRYLRPVGTKGQWDPTTPNQKASFRLAGKTPVYVYVPQHDLSLGLDLRGGMRVVLEIANRGEFDYSLTKKLESDRVVSEKKAQLTDAVKAALGDTEVTVDLNAERAAIITTVETSLEAEEQLMKITAAMAKVFPETGAFTAPKKEKIFKAVNEEVQSSVRNIMEKRVDPDGTKELSAYAKGENQVVIEIPGEKDPERVKKLLGETAEMTFMLLPQGAGVSEDSNGKVILTPASMMTTNSTADPTEETLKASMLVIRGSDLEPNSKMTYDQQGKPAVSFNIRKSAAARFGAVTGGNIGRYLAIVLDGKNVVSAPVIQGHISDHGIITGNFTPQEARDLSTVLNAGALPAKVTIVENRTVSATLGADSVSKSLVAGLIGLLAVLVFMIAYYRLPGIMASIALTVYVFLVLAVIKAFDSTLTLPGIAGIIISIGMAVDANVIIFERLKEELRTQKPLETAIDVAFSRAWTAILDSNVASIITGMVLYWLGSGAIQNFAVTLMIGVAVSLFTAVTVTRLLMKLMIRSKAGHNLAWYGV